MGAAEEPALKKIKTEEGAVEIKKEELPKNTSSNGDLKEKKEKKEKKDKEGKEKKEKKDKEGKEPKEGKEKKEKKDKEGKEKKDKKDKKEKKEKKDKKEGKEGKEPKEKKEKKDKKHKKDKKERKDKKIKKMMALKNAGKLGAKLGGKLAGKLKAGVRGKVKGKGKVQAKPATAPKLLQKSEDDYEPVNRWWERDDGAESGRRGAKKWDTFEHHGLLFAPEYETHGVHMIYDGKDLKLDPEAEEIATYWTSVKGTPYETKDIFVRNFWSVFKAVLPKDTIIKDFKKCDFTPIAEHRDRERFKRNNRSREEKEKERLDNAKQSDWYNYAIVNNIREKLGNFRLEPPQLFRGRGEHPKQGMLKKRTFPESVGINISELACVPRLNGMPGHAWKDIVHENSVQWIANFQDGLLEETKYVAFAATSGLKGQPDMLKYDRARMLVKTIHKIRESYEKLQKSSNQIDRQKATATYFIDILALRVGGEKDVEESADTVGCCSLRVEHLTLEPPNIINFDFLGKDSIQYLNRVTVTQQVYDNIASFMKGKKKTDDVFDKVAPSVVNEYFKEFQDDLSAKVFRTYNASVTLQSELSKLDLDKKSSMSQDQLTQYYNDANRAVAVLCNHQKAESKGHNDIMKKMEDVAKTMEKNIKALKKHAMDLESGKPIKANPDSKFPRDVPGCKKKIAETRMRLEKQKVAIQMKEDNKTVSLGTSKVNYMDPRITVAWCKKMDLAIEKVFPRTIRTKFPWAMHFKSSYVFE